jgi:ornithine carbamoyltransferase
MVARVGPHSDVANLAKHSSVPVINALSDDFHPLQTIADFLTLYETFPSSSAKGATLGLNGLKVAWVGDANNVLFDLAIGCVKMGVDISVAAPKGYEIPDNMRQLITSAADGVSSPGKLFETNVPEEAVKDANVLVTDTWVSMGQEADTQKRLKDFAGFQITSDLAKRGGAKSDWKFMHCLPRHPEEVADEVFYSPRSLVFPEAENRLWAAVCKSLRCFISKHDTYIDSCIGRLCRQQRQVLKHGVKTEYEWIRYHLLATLDKRWSIGARTIKIVLGIKSIKPDPFLENAIQSGH